MQLVKSRSKMEYIEIKVSGKLKTTMANFKISQNIFKIIIPS